MPLEGESVGLRIKQILELEDVSRSQEMESEGVYEVEGTDLTDVYR